MAAAYPMVGGVLHPDQSDTGDTMMASLYATLGVFLLLAVRNPSAHRNLIAFAAWSSFAHATVMSLLAIPLAAERGGFLIGSAGYHRCSPDRAGPCKAVGTAVGRNHRVGSRARKMGALHALLDANQGQVRICAETPHPCWISRFSE